MPSTAGIVASGSAQLDQWLRAHLVAFDERRADPLTNLGTLGSAGDATATGTRRLVNTGRSAVVWLPGVTGNGLSVPDEAALDLTSNIEVVIRVGLHDWTPPVGLLFAKGKTVTDNCGYRAYVNTDGTIRWEWSTTGASYNVGVTAPSPGFTDGSNRWLRFRLTGATGAASVEWAPDSDTEPTSGWSTLVASTLGATSVFANNQPFVLLNNHVFNQPLGGDFYRCVVRDAPAGTTVLDIDPSVLTDEGATSFTATTGQTVTINRGTGTGYRTEVVLPGGASRLFNGTSDFLEVADNDALDFSSAQSFSVWALIRTWGTSASLNALVSKKASSGFAVGNGYTLRYTNTFGQAVFNVSDGTNGPFAVPATNHTSGQLALLGGVRSVAADQLTATLNDVAGAAATDTTTATLSNTEAVRFGRLSGSGTNYATTRLYAWGIYPGALTAAQWAALRDALLVPERAAA